VVGQKKEFWGSNFVIWRNFRLKTSDSKSLHKNLSFNVAISEGRYTCTPFPPPHLVVKAREEYDMIFDWLFTCTRARSLRERPEITPR